MSTISIYLIKGTNVRKNVLIFFYLVAKEENSIRVARATFIYDTSQFIPVKILCFINVSQYNTCIDDRINEHLQFACKPE